MSIQEIWRSVSEKRILDCNKYLKLSARNSEPKTMGLKVDYSSEGVFPSMAIMAEMGMRCEEFAGITETFDYFMPFL